MSWDLATIIPIADAIPYFKEIAFSGLGAGTFEAARRGLENWRSRRVTRFWRRFVGQKLRIYVNERKIEGTGASADIGRRVGDGYYYTKGMAAAAWAIQRFAIQYLVTRELVEMVGSEARGDPDAACIVSLGSTDNKKTKQLLQMVKRRFVSDFVVSPDELQMNGHLLRPEFDNDGNGRDYALIVRVSFEKDEKVRELLIVAGMHMYGTEGAAMALTDPESLAKIDENVKDRNYAFVLRVDVDGHKPKAGQLDLEPGRPPLLQPLTKRP